MNIPPLAEDTNNIVLLNSLKDTTVAIKLDELISVLIRHDFESKDPNISMEDFYKHSRGICDILEALEKDYNTNYMLRIYFLASNRAGHSIGPLTLKIVHTLIKNGCKVNKITKILECKKDTASCSVHL